MLSESASIFVFAFVGGFAISAVILSIVILRRGKLYHRLKPEARPRRWVLYSLLFLFAVFAVWFPAWMTWPHALISRLLAGLFGFTFGVVGLTFRWFSGVVDWYFMRRGWPLQ